MTSTETKNKASRRGLVPTVVLGASSVGLYILLYFFAYKLPEIAKMTTAGHPLYALIPLGIALLFSFVHGAFTGHFWNLLGLKAKK